LEAKNYRKTGRGYGIPEKNSTDAGRGLNRNLRVLEPSRLPRRLQDSDVKRKN
jgi:hypothetical protein